MISFILLTPGRVVACNAREFRKALFSRAVEGHCLGAASSSPPARDPQAVPSSAESFLCLIEDPELQTHGEIFLKPHFQVVFTQGREDKVERAHFSAVIRSLAYRRVGGW